MPNTSSASRRTVSSASLGQAGGHDQLHPARSVLGLVVVPAGLRVEDDLAGPRGRRVAVPEHRALHLHPPPRGAPRGPPGRARRRAEGRVELHLRPHLRDPHRRAEPGGLHEQGRRQRPQVERAAVARHRVLHLRHAVGGQQVLEDRLVHGQRGRGHPRSHVGNVEQLQQSLNGAVLAERPVKRREHGVGAGQPASGLERQRARPRESSARRAPGGPPPARVPPPPGPPARTRRS